MAVVACGVLVVVSMFVMTQAYFPVRQPNYFGSPWYDTSCRESIEDLKALVEVSQSIKQDSNSYSCSTCATTFSEEIIMKLINALIFTATHNCGYNSGGGGYYPGGSNNVGGGNAGGGLIGGGNTLGVLGPVTGGGDTGIVNPGGTVSGSSSGEPSGKSDDGLINSGDFNGKDTLSLGLGGTKLLAVDVGKQLGSSDESLLDKGNNANSGTGVTYPTNSDTTVPTTTPVPSSPVVNAGTVPVNTGPVSAGPTPAIPTSSGLLVPVNNAPEGITSSPVANLPVAEGGSVLPNNSDNLGGVTNPTNAGDVNQVNQQVNKVTNIIPNN